MTAEEKARDLVEPVIGADRAERFVAAVGQLERLDSVHALRPLLQA